MPSRAYTSFLQKRLCFARAVVVIRVNALSCLYLISTRDRSCPQQTMVMCQCPLGLIPHFYEPEADGSFTVTASCQCPLGLIPHFYSWQSRSKWSAWMKCVNALSGLYLISTSESEAYSSYNRNVSMPSRAYTSFLRYPFKNLDFMRFSEPVFAGIYQNILITAVFRAC